MKLSNAIYSKSVFKNPVLKWFWRLKEKTVSKSNTKHSGTQI